MTKKEQVFDVILDSFSEKLKFLELEIEKLNDIDVVDDRIVIEELIIKSLNELAGELKMAQEIVSNIKLEDLIKESNMLLKICNTLLSIEKKHLNKRMEHEKIRLDLIKRLYKMTFEISGNIKFENIPKQFFDIYKYVPIEHIRAPLIIHYKLDKIALKDICHELQLPESKIDQVRSVIAKRLGGVKNRKSKDESYVIY